MDKIIEKIILNALSPAECSSLAMSNILDEEALRKLERLKRLRPSSMSDEAFLAICGVIQEDALHKQYSQPLELPTPLPVWAQWLETLFGRWEFLEQESYLHLYSYGDEELKLYGLEHKPWPLFPEFFHPVVAYARSLLAEDAVVQEAFAPEALAYSDRYLLFKLSQLSARSISYELKRSKHLKGETPKERYGSFCRETLATTKGLYDFFERYPVLARFVAQITQTHIQNVCALAHNLKNDLPDIVSYFAGNASLPCRKVIFGLSDPHRGGKTVAFVYLNNQEPLVYKPHALHVDKWYEEFIEWFNTLEGLLPMKTAKTLNKNTHGWSEYIRHSYCENEETLERFYIRQGHLLAIASLFNAGDIHRENVIAQDEYPVLIDLECFFQLIGFDASLPMCLDYPYDLHTTALLPSWMQGREDRPLFDDSGIFGSSHEAYAVKKPSWKHLYTDMMELVYDYPIIQPKNNIPQNNYRFHGAAPYAEIVIKGYELAMKILLGYREQLLNYLCSTKVSQTFVRSLQRDTQEYHDLLLWTTAPDILRSGASYDISLRILFLKQDSPADRQALYENEIKELWNRDIPSYYFYPDSKTLLCATGEVEECMPFIAVEMLREKIAHLPKRAIYTKTSFLKALFAMHFYRGIPHLDGADKNSCVVYAQQVGDVLCDFAVRCEENTAWINFRTFSCTSAKLANGYADPWLYDGVLGAGLFLANLYGVAPKPIYKELALGALRQSLQTVAYLKQHSIALPLGAYTGIYGVVFALLEFGRIFSDEALTHQAMKLIKETPLDIETDIEIDFINGIAGILPVLKKVYILHNDTAYVELMSRICQKIGDSIIFDSGIAYHKNREQMPLGLAHGMIGIAYALSCVCDLVPKDLGMQDWIEQAIAYEERFYDKDEKDWPDIRRKGEKPFFMLGWCAGAPGQGLARIGIYKNIPSLAHRETMEVLAETTRRRFYDKSSDHLCCGKASQIWFLQEAARYLRLASLQEESREMANKLLAQYRHDKVWRLQSVIDNEKNPSLFGGASGIALSVLRRETYCQISDVLLLS